VTRRYRARQLLIEDSVADLGPPDARAPQPTARARSQWSLPMKSLEFERISVADVRREIDAQHKSHERRRMPQSSSVLLDETSRWIAELPANVRPIALARKFPRIANSIAELWRRVARCEEYLDTL